MYFVLSTSKSNYNVLFLIESQLYFRWIINKNTTFSTHDANRRLQQYKPGGSHVFKI